MYLKCPVCGFSFGVVFPDDITEKEKVEIMECPCGAMCEETEELHPNVWEPPKEEANHDAG